MQILLNLIFDGGIAASNSIIIIEDVLKAPRILLNARF